MDDPTVFISYSSQDADWVRAWLLPRLEAAGLRAWIDYRDFEIGVPSLINIERAIERSHKTLLVLTPHWLASQWTNFESLLLQTQDPAGLRRCLLPLMLQDCQLPGRLAIFTYADFRAPARRETELARLVHQIKAGPDAALLPASSPPPPAPSRVSLAKLPSTSPVLFGRADELAGLDAAWDDTAKKTNLVCLVAWGGVGKTALVNKWLLDMGEAGYRGATRVLGWSFYSQGAAEGKQAAADQFIASALDWFGDPDPAKGSPWDKGERLADLVRRQRTLLVLDGLEPLQHPPPMETGRIKDPALQSLLCELAHRNPGLCIITTRLPVADLKGFEGSTVNRIDLEHLSPEAGAQLLAHLGVQGTLSECEQAARGFKGHALALTLLGRYLADVYDGEIRKRDLIPRLADDEEQGAHARKMMAAYEKWFAGRPEQAILRVMGLFDRPAEAGTLAVLRAGPVIPGLTDALFYVEPQKGVRALFRPRKPEPLGDQEWKRALANLRHARLVDPPNPHEPEALDCHPLLREYFGERLREEQPAAWREGHRRLYEYYRSAAPDLPETLEEMAPLFAAVSHGCAAGLHQQAYDEVYRLRIRRGNEAFSVHMLGAFGADLAALAGFFALPWSRTVEDLREDTQARVLNWAGFRLRALGRLHEAAEPMQVGLEADLAREDWRNAAIAAGNLSQLWVTLGDLGRALAYARQSVDLADRSGDIFRRMVNRTALADTQHQAGRGAEAGELFVQAEAMQRELQPANPLLYSAQGYCYCDLLLDQGEYAEVLRRAAQAIEIAKRNKWLLDIGLDQLSLGRAHLGQALQSGTGAAISPGTGFSQAEEGLDRAVEGLRVAGYQDFLTRGLLARAALRRAMGDYTRARRDLEEAMEVATRGGMRLFEADGHLEAARLALAQGDRAGARAGLDAARALIEETGYHRRDGEVAELEERLKPTADR